MSDSAVDLSASRRGGFRLLPVLLPGLPQLLAGRWGVGGLALLVWIGLWAVLLTRWSQFVEAWGGPLDHRVAALIVVVGLACAVAWSVVDAEKPPGTPGTRDAGSSQWDLTTRAFGHNWVATLALMTIATVWPFCSPSVGYVANPSSSKPLALNALRNSVSCLSRRPEPLFHGTLS